MRSATILCLLAAYACLGGGCATYTKPVVPPQPMTAQQKNFEAVWSVSQDVLRKYDFTIDSQDRRQGLIITHAMVGKQFFEFWRKDAIGCTDVTESTIQSIYRVATVSIEPASAAADQYKAGVEVQVYRSEKPSRIFSSVSQAYSLFELPGGERNTHLLEMGPWGTLQARPTDEGVPDAVVSLGRDDKLEQAILADIQAGVSAGTGER